MNQVIETPERNKNISKNFFKKRDKFLICTKYNLIRIPQKIKSDSNKKFRIHIKIREYQKQRENSKKVQGKRTNYI